MALIDCDSFDYYTTVADRWTEVGITIGSPSIGAVGRNSTNGIRMPGARAGVYRTLPTNYATLIVGRSVKIATLGTSAFTIFGFGDGGTVQINILIGTSGEILVWRGPQSGATGLASTSAGVYTAGTEVYFEAKVTFNGSTGAVEVRKNGTAVLTASSLDTTQSANNYANRIYIGADGTVNNTAGANADADDYYLCDTSGSTNNDFLGDIRVECLLPSGAGNSTQWTPSAGSNYQCVDETAVNGDTDYVSSSNIGDKDTYAMGNLSSTAGTVFGVATKLRARKDDAGTRTLKSVVRLSATESNGASIGQGTSYAEMFDIFETKPGGGSWSTTDVNNMEAGVEVVA